MNRFFSLLGIILLGLLCANINYIASKKFKNIRLDFTERGLFTLSEGTRAILKKIQSPLKAKLYYAKTASLKGPESLRFYNNYYTYIKELLLEYEGVAGKNKFRLEVIDPRPDTDEEADALKYGLKRFQITEEENFFFGLAVLNEAGNEEVIPFFAPEKQDFVEYEISKLITSVNKESKKKLGVISSLPVLGDDISGFMAQMMRMQGKQVRQAWISFQVLKQSYELQKIETSVDKIPDVDVLLVVHPKNFSDKTLYAIDQYIMGGGKAIFFVDNYCYADQPVATRNPLQSMVAARNSSINKLLKGWGVEQVEKLFPGDHSLAQRVPLKPGQTAGRFLGFLRFGKSSLNQNDIITSQLNDIQMIFPAALKSSLTASNSKQLTIVPLIETTDKAGFYAMDVWEFQQPDGEKILEKFVPGKEKLMLAAKIYGTFSSNFPSGPPEEKDKDKKAGKDEKDNEKERAKRKKEHLKESKKETSIIVFSDVDFFTDNFAFQRTFFGPAAKNGNHNIILNSVENISGTNDLIRIRARGRFKRPFIREHAIQKEADHKTELKIKDLNIKIKKFQSDLQGLQSKANKENIQLLQAEAIKKQKELRHEIAKYQKQLRVVKRKRRQKIEELESDLRFINLFLMPVIMALIGCFVWFMQQGFRPGRSSKNFRIQEA
ncbi:Gldg family protein [Candidatus Riflebacteria bacterium]